MSSEVFDDLEIYQPDNEPVRKPKPRRFKGKCARFKLIFLKPPKGEVKFCKACKAPTSGNKPYCIKHLGRMPYVVQLRKQLTEEV